MKYTLRISAYFLAVVIMVSLAIFIVNDYILTAIYLGIIVASVIFRREKADLLILVVGFFGTLIGESLFLSTGIETFTRTTLLGIMPLWLPFLWSYIFLAIKRVSWMLIKETP
ncbi:MAG: hypothetical protein HYT62_00655 [Candidatus Yanofskybacteria bacterium]|nr:hypothetical protein [Candidatus Yanofskybacteria bacterium]